jgi:putative endonuclease
MKNSLETGLNAEGVACEYLQNLGYKIVERNVRAKFSEIDIVTIKDGVYRFVEVKSGIGFDPVYNFTPQKLTKILRGVNLYIASKKIDTPYAIDLVVVRDGECELYENVTF